jgi:UDP-2,3-diacylglucosamine hydrolase
MRRVFLSDVHLSPRDPARQERLLKFLEREAPRTDELYILGDLFDYWIGPKHLALPDYQGALEALRRASAGGTRIFFLLGNRDFYVRRRFARATGVEVVPGRTEHALAVGSSKVYLCHGDYMEGRRGLGFRIQEWIRTRPVEAVFTRLPAPFQKGGARFYRWLSDLKKQFPGLYGRFSRLKSRLGRRRAGGTVRGPHGLCQEDVAARVRRGADIIVCGHIHKPGAWPLVVDGRRAMLYTLGDWSGGESYLEEEGGRWRLCGEADPEA